MPAFAAVDIGSNSVRLSVADLRGGRLVPLHQDREVTRLGEGVFKDGNLDPQAMAHSLKVLRKFHRAVQTYAVERTRVVATSALRDSKNGHIFADWVRSVTGWKLETISGLEEGRLIHLGVISSLRSVPSKLLLLDLGGGSCELILSEKGHIKDIVSLPLGAVRLTEEFVQHDPPTKQEMKRLRDFVTEESKRIPRNILRSEAPVAIATSGTAAALAGAAQSLKLGKENFVSLQATSKLGKRLAKLTVRQRAAIKGINSKRAEIVIAGAVVYSQLLSLVGARGFRFSPLGLRDGLLAQMSAEYDQGTRSHRQMESDREDVLARMATRYRIDTTNANQVRDLALAIFDQTKKLHGLSPDFLEWIATAASLYEVGAFVNPVGRHRHAYYIIAQSELFGFTPLQRKIIATIARYQGNSRPQVRDRLIKALPAQMRADVLKATALLRVARALNQGRRNAVQRVKVAARDGHVRFDVAANRGGADLELWAAEKEIAYFREVFGRELSFTLL